MYQKLIVSLIISLFAVNLYSQDFSVYQQLLEEGRVDEVYQSLQYIEDQYPNHPFVLYLNAAKEKDGELAFEQFNNIVKKHPRSFSGERATIKIAEYLYSKGLYTQTSEQLKVFPDAYPESKNIEHVFDLLKKSFSAIGESDSIALYESKFNLVFPQNNFEEYDIYKNISEKVDFASLKENSKTTSNGNNNYWCVQVGAFGELKNANVIANRLKSAGYQVDVVEKTDRINLYLVQVLRYNSIEEAIDIGEELQEKFGIKFRVVQR